MKKTMSFFLVLALITFILMPFASAQAPDDALPRPVLPDGIPEEIMPPVPDRQSDTEIILAEGDDPLMDVQASSVEEGGAPGELAISVQEREPAGSTTQTWDVSVEGGTAPYSYQFYMVLPTYVNGKLVYYSQGQQQYSRNSSFTFTFQYDGEYQLWVEVRDSGGHATRYVHAVSVTNLGVQPLRISISAPQGDFFTDVTSWNIDFLGGSGYYKYSVELVDLEMDIRVLHENGSVSTDSSVLCFHIEKDYSTDSQITFSYRFLASSRYELRVWLEDDIGLSTYSSQRFSAYDERYPTIYEKATEIVNQCRAEGVTGDYQTALWLHDWVTKNAEYDDDLGHYHADGVLCGGYGVCDSYAKAYLLLLKEAGIPADRVNNIEHAWNVVQLGGEWYYADCTWDDCGTGFEHHMYCFIPEEILSVDHPFFYDVEYVCDNYLYNYYVQNGEAQAWADSLAEQISGALQEGSYCFSLPFPESYTFEGLLTRSSRLEAGVVLADRLSVLLAMERQYVYQETGETIPLSFESVNGEYDSTGKYLNAGTLNCEADFPELSLPAGLKSLEAQAFQGDTGLSYVIVPEGTESIGSGAFAGCSGLWMVMIPRSVTSIAGDAFEYNKHLTLCVPSESYALQYAIDNRLSYQVIPD